MTKRYKAHIVTGISQLPKKLINPTPLHSCPQAPLIHTFYVLGADDSLPPAAKLCTLHRKLNAQVIASALGMIENEVEEHMDEMLKQGERNERSAARDAHQVNKYGQFTPTRFSEEARRVCAAAASVVAPVLSAEEYKHFYRHPPPLSCKTRSPVYDPGCGACVLARIGSSADILTALRASLLTRANEDVQAGVKRCVQLEWIESCCEAMGEKGVDVLMRSGRIAEWGSVSGEPIELPVGEGPVHPWYSPQLSPAAAVPRVRQTQTQYPVAPLSALASSQAVPDEEAIARYRSLRRAEGRRDVVSTPTPRSTWSASSSSFTTAPSSASGSSVNTSVTSPDLIVTPPMVAHPHSRRSLLPEPRSNRVSIADKTLPPLPRTTALPVSTRSHTQAQVSRQLPSTPAPNHADSNASISISPSPSQAWQQLSSRSTQPQPKPAPPALTRQPTDVPDLIDLQMQMHMQIPYPIPVLMASLRPGLSIDSAGTASPASADMSRPSSWRRSRMPHQSLLPLPLQIHHEEGVGESSRAGQAREIAPPVVRYDRKPVLERVWVTGMRR